VLYPASESSTQDLVSQKNSLNFYLFIYLDEMMKTFGVWG
jgi:hypothetical protein